MEPFAEAPGSEQLSAGNAVRWFELCLVVLICFGDATISSLHILSTGIHQAGYSPAARWGYLIFQEVLGLSLLGYVLWRRGLRIRNLGLSWSWKDMLSGIPVAIIAMVVSSLGYWFVLFLFHQTHAQVAAAGWSTAHQIFGRPSLIAIPFMLLNPFFEEVVVRAYVMTEIAELSGSWLLAGAVSVAVQTTYHLYYGWVGALTLAFQFIVYASYYGIRRKATPIVIAHGIFDVLGMAKLWLS